MCRLLGVSRSAYYDYEQCRRNQSDDLYHRELLDAVKNTAKLCDYTYGSRRMRRALSALALEDEKINARGFCHCQASKEIQGADRQQPPVTGV